MAKTSLDAIDRRILGYLIKNARMPFLEIARECGISGAAIHQRVKKLEDAGVILGSRLEVDPKALGYDVPPTPWRPPPRRSALVLPPLYPDRWK